VRWMTASLDTPVSSEAAAKAFWLACHPTLGRGGRRAMESPTTRRRPAGADSRLIPLFELQKA
jgi:hypothetical protein